MNSLSSTFSWSIGLAICVAATSIFLGSSDCEKKDIPAKAMELEQPAEVTKSRIVAVSRLTIPGEFNSPSYDVLVLKDSINGDQYMVVTPRGREVPAIIRLGM